MPEPEPEESGLSHDGWFARIVYTDGQRETVPLCQIQNFTPKTINDYNAKEKYVIISSLWEKDKRPRKYKGYIVRIGETLKLLEESLRKDRERPPVLNPSESDILSTSDDEQTLATRLKPGALDEMKRKAAEKDYENFLNAPSSSKKIKKSQQQSTVDLKDPKKLESFIASKQAASVSGTATVEVQNEPQNTTPRQNFKSYTSGSQSQSAVFTPETQDDHDTHSPGAGRSYGRKVGYGNHNPGAGKPSASSSCVTPTQQPTSKHSTLSHDKSRKSLMSAASAVFESSVAFNASTPVPPASRNSPSPVPRHNSFPGLEKAVRNVVKSELCDFRSSLLEAVKTTVQSVLQEEVKGMYQRMDSLEDMVKKQGSSGNSLISEGSSNAAAGVKIISEAEDDLGYGVTCTTAGWREMSAATDELSWCSALLMGVYGESAALYRYRTKKTSLKTFSEEFKKAAKAHYLDFAVTKLGRKTPSRKEIEAVYGKLSRRARDLNGRRNRVSSLDLQTGGIQRFVDPETGLMTDENGIPVDDDGIPVDDGMPVDDGGALPQISDSTLMNIMSMQVLLEGGELPVNNLEDSDSN